VKRYLLIPRGLIIKLEDFVDMTVMRVKVACEKA